MFLKYSDVTWQWLRLSESYSRLLVLSDVSTRYVLSLVKPESIHPVERLRFGLGGTHKDSLSSFDAIHLSYSRRTRDTVLPAERMFIKTSSRVPESLAPVDVVSVRFSSPFSEVKLASDRIVTNFTLRVRDVVGLNEGFFFGGVFKVDVNNVVFPLDQFSTLSSSSEADVASVEEFVRVGLRHMIDFYLGGFTIGSVVFGGRLR